MSYHIVSIDSPKCSLTCRDGQLICRTDEGEKKLPLEDVASIIITSFSASIHSQLFLEAAKQGVALIICETFRPVSLILPANRSTDTLLTRALLKLSPSHVNQLWRATVDAKCLNQLSLAEYLSPEDAAMDALRDAAQGRKAHKEAVCAKLFWQIYGRSQGETNFSRERSQEGLNSLLNYGYAVLLSTVLQKLFGVGLDPTFGISHATRERSAPLAYDLMEPFRPCVDWRVVQWVRQNPKAEALEVTPEFRRWVTGFPLERIDYLDLTLEVRGCIEGVVRGFAGLRTAELQRLDWSEIDLNRGFITVAASKAKTRQRRLVPISDNLKLWLTPLRQSSGPVCLHQRAQRPVADLCEGFTWAKNGLRHSYISYRLAILHDTARVALEAGNSPEIIFGHYRELVTPEAAKAWFAVTPT